MATEEITMELVEATEKRIEDLRNQFEQYFMGNRKRPPLQERASLQALMRRMSNQTIPNVRVRFRFQQMIAKFNSYNSYWNRTLTQMENGTYFRSKFKAKISSPPPSAPPSPGPKKGKKDDENIEQVYQDFIEARKQLKQSTNISKEKLAESIKKQMPALEKRYAGKDIKFKVVVEDGKAKLKATVK